MIKAMANKIAMAFYHIMDCNSRLPEGQTAGS